MATFILVVSLCLSLWSFWRTRTLAREGHAEAISAKLHGILFEFSTSLAAVLLFYHAILFVLDTGWQWITVADLLRLEQWLTVAQQTLERYTPHWITWMVVFAILYLLGRMGICFLERDSPFRIVRRVKSGLHIVNTLILLLGSFTLLGFQPGKAATTLEINLTKERKEYGVLQREVAKAVRAATINRAVDNAGNTFPNATRVPRYIKRSITDGAALQRQYGKAKVMYAIQDPRIDAVVKQNKKQQALVKRALHRVPLQTARKPTQKEPRLPGTVTYAGILKARAAVEAYRKRVRPEVLRFLNSPGGREFVLNLPDGPIDHLTQMLNPLGDAFPVLKPIFDAASSALADVAESTLDRKILDLTRAIAERSQNADAQLSAAPKDLLNTAPRAPTPEAVQQFGRRFAVLKHQVNQIHGWTHRLARAVQLASAQAAEASQETAAQGGPEGSGGAAGPASPPTVSTGTDFWRGGGTQTFSPYNAPLGVGARPAGGFGDFHPMGGPLGRW